jgi:hypothetical protein
MELCARQGPVTCTFVIVCAGDHSAERETVLAGFAKVRSFVTTQVNTHFHLEIWDDPLLAQKERDLGIKLS